MLYKGPATGEGPTRRIAAHADCQSTVRHRTVQPCGDERNTTGFGGDGCSEHEGLVDGIVVWDFFFVHSSFCPEDDEAELEIRTKTTVMGTIANHVQRMER